jgi:hypothetical protein
LNACNADKAYLADALFQDVRFVGCTAHHAYIGGAIFVNCDLQPFIEARTLLDGGRLTHVDWQAVLQSLAHTGLERFLLERHMPDVVVTYTIESARAVDPKLLRRLMQSTFISYGTPDASFARGLRDSLRAKGVITFFFESDAIPGEKLHHVMREGINTYDRVILICSEASLTRPGVRNEIEETLVREARAGGANYLIPVILDDFVFRWRDTVAAALTSRVVADFRKEADGGASMTDDERWERNVMRLLQALTRK